MDKKELIKKMVDNYYAQVSIVGQTSMTLEEYLKDIFSNSPGQYTEADLQYGLSLAK